MSEGAFQTTLPLLEEKPFPLPQAASRRIHRSILIPTRIFICFGAVVILTTLLIYRKASFPKNPSDFWSQRTIDSIISRAPALLDPKSEDIHGLTQLGIACYQKGPDYYVEGLKALERARYLGALDDRVFWYAATMYENKGLIRFALEDYERYLRIHPSDTTTELRVASLYYKGGDVASATKHYEIVLDAWPHNPIALYDMASIYYQQGNYAKAQPLFEKCLSLSGDLPMRGHFMLGQAYEVKGLYQQALLEYQKEFAKDKSDLNLLKALAGTYEHLGQESEAKQIWSLAFQAYPNDAYVRLKAGKSAVNVNKGKKARKHR